MLTPGEGIQQRESNTCRERTFRRATSDTEAGSLARDQLRRTSVADTMRASSQPRVRDTSASCAHTDTSTPPALLDGRPHGDRDATQLGHDEAGAACPLVVVGPAEADPRPQALCPRGDPHRASAPNCRLPKIGMVGGSGSCIDSTVSSQALHVPVATILRCRISATLADTEIGQHHIV